jgi:curved DNA-binding protein
MAFVDYYKILGLTKNATEKEIKQAYRRFARKYHPDVNPNDVVAEAKFKEINQANEVLSNPENRKKYDNYGEHWQHTDDYEKAKHKNQNANNGENAQQYSDEAYASFFENMFGGSSYKNQAREVKFRGQDFNAALQLNLSDVYTSQKRTLTVNDKNIRITIPEGIENGQIIKIKGHGGKGVNGGPNGDLFIQLSIINNSEFKRDGNNLYTSVDVGLYKAILGGEIMVNTFDGKVKLSIKPETQNGTKIKLKGKGFPVYKKEGQFGDLFITFNVEIPKNLSVKEKELFEELSKLR